jgi:hypothetical protein
MPLGNLIGRIGKGAAVAAVVAAAVGFTVAPQPAQAISGGEAAGIGVGAFALGAVLGSQAAPAPAPYYAPGYYPAPAPYYAPAAPGYYPGYAPRTCWSPYYRQYVAC